MVPPKDGSTRPPIAKGLAASRLRPSRTGTNFFASREPKGVDPKKQEGVDPAAVGPGTDAYLARAAALKFELHNYHRMPPPPKIRALAPLKRQTRIQAKNPTPIRQAGPPDSLEAVQTHPMHPPRGKIKEKNPLHAYLQVQLKDKHHRH